ncbi:RNA polymerase subunit sigma-70 [Corynebacterium sp. NML140438]|uniref:sigma-70 family RNA polymerase sigma factor n=1 Tax=Corynebacterium sp. NML140438 TaxID=1906334 RepID=UPI0008FBAC5E|nr:sigma-70 family RNA polymerase sigma factor [Corynebacterium sp. NML140438]OIR40522.1 RNA polymerase subunit sigma-70 [Corynebacterium sp. NML140438]
MATEPAHIKIQLKFERTEKISQRYPTSSTTYYITADQAEIMIERDLELRRQEAEEPQQVKRRCIYEICDELSKRDYNNARQQLRNTTYRSVAAKDDDEELSIVDVAVSNEGMDPAENWVTSDVVRQALDQLDAKERMILVGVRMHGYTQAQIAKALGISQPAVAKRLKKAETRLRELLL